MKIAATGRDFGTPNYPATKSSLWPDSSDPYFSLREMKRNVSNPQTVYPRSRITTAWFPPLESEKKIIHTS
jgi:hypothetical protein